MALTEFNGNNETHIQISKSLSFSLHDEKANEISKQNQINPISFWIQRDSSLVEPYSFFGVLNSSKLNGGRILNGFYVNGFNLSGSNVHLQLKPVNLSLNYLIMIKFGDNPVLRDKNNYYDNLALFEPKNLISDNKNESHYLFFLNMSQIKSFKGYVGYSIKELPVKHFNASNIIEYVSGLNNKSSFTNNFLLRTYSSGCYYTDTSSHLWSSN
jgi:hypothetical protein